MRSVSRVTLVLAVGLSVQQFSRAVVAQECSLARYVGRVPGREGARFSPSISADEFQVRETGNSTRSLRGTAQAPGKADSTGDPVLGRDRYPLYRLRSGDLLDVNFTFSPELNQTLSIGPDGYLRLKGAGNIHAEGLTVPELEIAIGRSYAGVLRDPEISVALKEFEKPYFLALGQVAHPGKYELRSALTLSEAMAVAGGFTQQARHSQIILFRHVSDDVVEAHVLNLKKMLARRDLREDLPLQPGDLIFVPQSSISKIQRFMPSAVLGTYVNPMQF